MNALDKTHYANITNSDEITSIKCRNYKEASAVLDILRSHGTRPAVSMKPRKSAVRQTKVRDADNISGPAGTLRGAIERRIEQIRFPENFERSVSGNIAAFKRNSA